MGVSKFFQVTVLLIFVPFILGSDGSEGGDSSGANGPFPERSDSIDASGGIQPNILLIVADDLGFYDIGYHGDQIKTPRLDALAESGVKLENFYVQPTCSPTRSALMSGRYQIHNGNWHGNVGYLPPDSLTMAEQLKKAGYQTHMAGKWHLGHREERMLPTKRGFDTFYGFLGGFEHYFSHKRWHNGSLVLDWGDENGPIEDEDNLYSTHLLTNRTIDKIKNHESCNGPMFFYLAYQSVHSPLEVPTNYSDRYNTIEDKDRRTYAGMVTAMDEGIGKIVDELKVTRMWDNTIIVFFSDNGGTNHHGGYNWPLRGEKFGLFEGGVRTIGFVAGGLVGQSGVVNTELMHVTDWFPTFVNLAKGNYTDTKKLDGFDQWKTINDPNAKSPRQEILHNIDSLYPAHGILMEEYKDIWNTSVRAAIRIGDLKLLTGDPGPRKWRPVPGVFDTTGTGVTEPSQKSSKKKGKSAKKHRDQGDGEPEDKNLWLFDVKADPEERKDLSSERPDDVRRLLRKLAEYNKGVADVVYDPWITDPQ